MRSKAALVFLHGWALGPEVWAGLEKYFSKERVIKVNYHKGVTGSPAGNGISPYAAVALEAVRRKRDEPVVLVGWSLGAIAALELAGLISRNTARAGLRDIAGPGTYPTIAGLILVGGTARFTRTTGYDGGLPEVVVKRMKKRLTGNPGRTLEEFYDQMFTLAEQEEGVLKRFREEISSRGPAWSEEELAAGLDFLMNRDLRRYLNNIETPSLIIHGDSDEICPAAAGRHLHENLSSSQLHLIPGCGHMPFFSKVDIFYEIVGRWLDNLD